MHTLWMQKVIKLTGMILFFSIPIFFSSVYASKIVELNIKGPIGPATADYIERGIHDAQSANLILIIIDTPGGLDESTRIIIQSFLISNVPIVTFVSPKGARAASAGTYLMYASTLAAMAPGTQLGAASPISLIGGSEENKTGKEQSVMNKKVTNDAVATIRSLAQLRGRNSFFAESAVLNATSITATEALKKGVINFIAKDNDDLLAQLNRVVVTQNNHEIKIDTTKQQLQVVNPGWRTQFLSIITNPTVAYLLLLLGIYGIFFELSSPGFVLPGVAGTLGILLALYALQLLPVNYAGLALIVIGITFIIAEAFTPSFGALGVGGTIAFIIGSIMLIDTEYVPYRIAWQLIWGMAVVNILIFGFILHMVIQSRRQKVKHGLVMMVGAKGTTINETNLHGQALIRGEIWSIYSRTPIKANKNIRVVSTKGLFLEVEEDLSDE